MAGFEGLDASFASRLNQMMQASGGRFGITSGFRSVERQQQLWDAAVAKYGDPEVADNWVARPGKSHHNFGIAADLWFADAAAREWVHSNASKYGLQFPMSWEPWHIEPFGQAARGNRDAYTTPPGDLLNPVDAAHMEDPSDPAVQMRRLVSFMQSNDIETQLAGPKPAGGPSGVEGVAQAVKETVKEEVNP